MISQLQTMRIREVIENTRTHVKMSSKLTIFDK